MFSADLVQKYNLSPFSPLLIDRLPIRRLPCRYIVFARKTPPILPPKLFTSAAHLILQCRNRSGSTPCLIFLRGQRGALEVPVPGERRVELLRTSCDKRQLAPVTCRRGGAGLDAKRRGMSVGINCYVSLFHLKLHQIHVASPNWI